MKFALIILLFLSGCVSAPKVVVTYGWDELGVAVPVVNGERFEMTDEERKIQANLYLDKFCK